tara:strand:+ start:57353 stop:57775 length:423 start_codon:yes stop_codon:yes gene_type:complete
MTSILPAPLKIQDLAIKDDNAKLVWDFTLRCQTKKSLSLITELRLIQRSPMDADRITFESKDIKLFKDTIELQPGVEKFSREISLAELKSIFQSTISELTQDRKSSHPFWQLRLKFTDSNKTETFGLTFKPAPENWFHVT